MTHFNQKNRIDSSIKKSDKKLAKNALLPILAGLCLSITACTTGFVGNSPAVTATNASELNNKLSVNTDIDDINTNSADIAFLDKADANKLLTIQDDYFSAFSKFDWQSKFKSDKPLSEAQLYNYYDKATVQWTPEYKLKVTNAVLLLKQKTASLGLNQPDSFKFILSNGLVEYNSAYTRGDYIVLPTDYLDRPQSFINHLVAHEFFHVYSRFNRKNQDKLYATVNFKRTTDLVLPVKFASLTITNPDAPKINQTITLTYQGKEMTFMPILHSDDAYIKDLDIPLFVYFENDLVAVKYEKNKVVPLLIEGNPLFVKKEDTNYDEIVKPNSDYLNHPEEVLAESFALWVTDEEITHKKPVNDLIKTMKSIY